MTSLASTSATTRSYYKCGTSPSSLDSVIDITTFITIMIIILIVISVTTILTSHHLDCHNHCVLHRLHHRHHHRQCHHLLLVMSCLNMAIIRIILVSVEGMCGNLLQSPPFEATGTDPQSFETPASILFQSFSQTQELEQVYIQPPLPCLLKPYIIYANRKLRSVLERLDCHPGEGG